jgi:hypothetical protein
VDQKNIQEFAPKIMALYKTFEFEGPDGMDWKGNFLLH